MGRPLFDRPIIIIGCSRGGTTIMYRNLAEHPATWSLYEESYQIIYDHHPLDPENGDRLADPPSGAVADAIVQALHDEAHNREVFQDTPVLRWVPPRLIKSPLNRLYKRPPLRFVEKTPANALRVPFLAALFPDARFIFVVRRAEAVISSLMEGWKRWSGTGSGTWAFDKWHYVAPPGWQEWTGRPLEEICAFQWVQATGTARTDLEEHCPERFLMVRHEEAVARPLEVYGRILEFCDLPRSAYVDRLLADQEHRHFTYGGSAPRPAKWKELHGDEVERVRPMFRGLMAELYPDGP
jgi:hypothetical protein